MQEGKRLKNTRINLQDEDSTIIAFNTTEVCEDGSEDGSENMNQFISTDSSLFLPSLDIFVIIISLDVIPEDG